MRESSGRAGGDAGTDFCCRDEAARGRGRSGLGGAIIRGDGPLPDGSYELVLSGQQLMARLALLVPRPKVHLVRYRGVFASNSRWRKLVVPLPTQSAAASAPSGAPEPARPADLPSSANPERPDNARRLPGPPCSSGGKSSDVEIPRDQSSFSREGPTPRMNWSVLRITRASPADVPGAQHRTGAMNPLPARSSCLRESWRRAPPPGSGPPATAPFASFLPGRRVPTLLGYDPLFQFLHEDDTAQAIVLALEKRLHGVFNVAGPQPLPLSVIIRESGRTATPIPAPLIALALGRGGLPRLPRRAP